MNDPEIIEATTDDSVVRIHEEKAYQGWLGKIFGSPTHAQTNIVGLLIVFLLVLIGLCVYKNLQDSLKILVPILTLAVGYLFGNKG